MLFNHIRYDVRISGDLHESATEVLEVVHGLRASVRCDDHFNPLREDSV